MENCLFRCPEMLIRMMNKSTSRSIACNSPFNCCAAAALITLQINDDCRTYLGISLLRLADWLIVRRDDNGERLNRTSENIRKIFRRNDCNCCNFHCSVLCKFYTGKFFFASMSERTKHARDVHAERCTAEPMVFHEIHFSIGAPI